MPDTVTNAANVRFWESPIDIEWANRGDEFITHIQNIASTKFCADVLRFETSNPGGGGNRPFYTLSLEIDDTVLDTEFCLFSLSDRIQIGLRFHVDDESIAGQAENWTSVIKEALDHMNLEVPAYKWAALIGVSTDLAISKPQTLITGLAIGGLQVEPSTRIYFDSAKPTPASLSTSLIKWTYPAAVKGVACGFDWAQASETAGRNLGRLCALLSVAFDERWCVLESPSEFRDERQMQFPSGRRGLIHGSVDDNYDHVDVSPPAWLTDEIWNRIAQDEDLDAALHAHYQGISLEEAAPSFALVAHVAAIEGLGARLSELERCDACKAQKGAMRRFRTALERVMPEAEAKSMTKKIYGLRSETAHSGRLHADEMLQGLTPAIRVFSRDPRNSFRFGALRTLRRASRLLLIEFLTSNPLRSDKGTVVRD